MDDIEIGGDAGVSKPKEEPSKQHLLPASILVAAVLISGSIIYAVGVSSSKNQAGSGNQAAGQNPGQSAAGNDILKQNSSRDVVLGDPKAPITMIEYGDYQCPYCAKFFKETEPLIREQYVKTGKVKIVYRNFVINDRTPGNHESHWSAEAAECAKDQSKFWEFHDAIFNAESKDGQENNGNLNRALFLSVAGSLKMDVNKFTSCIDAHTYQSVVQAESDGAIKLGVQATPTLFVNNQKIEGAYPFAAFQQAIDAELVNKK